MFFIAQKYRAETFWSIISKTSKKHIVTMLAVSRPMPAEV